MTIVENSNTLPETFTNFFFPRICALCNKPGRFVCSDCEKLLAPAELRCIVCSRKNPLGVTCPSCLNPLEPTSVLATFKYETKTKELIHLFKYDDTTSLKTFLAEKICPLIKKIDCHQSYCVTYIPLASRKYYRRGYNQSKLIARCIAASLKGPLTDLLMRVEAHQSQALAKSRKERLLSIKGAFTLKAKPPENVLLVDDVITSGATMREATKILKKNGAKRVVGVSIAM